jgi:dienelactone hydrolase
MSRSVAALLMLMTCAVPSSADPTRIDVQVADGSLAAVYTSPGKAGPAVVLLHQCNMDRKAWDGLAAALRDRGVHSLAFDYRGTGDNRGLAADHGRLAGDFDAALEALRSQPGVDATRIAAAGASCGVDRAVQLARRTGRIRALALLSGPTSDEGLAYIRTSGLAVFFAFSADEGGPLPAVQRGVEASANRASTTRVLEHAGHGVEMFRAHPELLTEVVGWLAEVLR